MAVVLNNRTLFDMLDNTIKSYHLITYDVLRFNYF